MPSPEFIERAKKFQRVFAPYFPQLDDDFHACVGMEFLWHGFRMNPLQTARKQQARRDLQQLMYAIRRLSRNEVPYLVQVGIELHTEAAAEEKAGTPGYYSLVRFQEAILGFLLALDDMRDEELTEKVLSQFAEKANREIDRLPEQSNINWEAVHGRCRGQEETRTQGWQLLSGEHLRLECLP